MRLLSFARVPVIVLVLTTCSSAVPWQGSGPVAMRVTLPAAASEGFEPLLSVGRAGSGDVVGCRRLPDGRVCFGWEQTGTGTVLSDPVAAPSPGSHEVLVSLGSLFSVGEMPAELEAVRETAFVQFDGHTVLVVKGRFSSNPANRAVLGKNFVGGSLVGGIFSGDIGDAVAVELRTAFALVSKARQRPAVRGSLGPVEQAEYPGPVRIKLWFPRNATGRNEPIVVTGVTGRGDFIYVRYVDEQHIRLGFDHWLVGGPLTEPLRCDFAVPHELTLSLGSLLPPPDSAQPDSAAMAALRSHCIVQFDGHTVISCVSAFHPTAPGQISLGANRIGGSTADELFYGKIVQAERMKPEEMAAALR